MSANDKYICNAQSVRSYTEMSGRQIFMDRECEGVRMDLGIGEQPSEIRESYM